MGPDATREMLLSYYRAHGGNTRVENLISLRFDGTITYPEREPISFRLYKKRPKLMRYELELTRRKTLIMSANLQGFQQQIRQNREYLEPSAIEDSRQVEMLKMESTFDGYLWQLRSKNRTVEAYEVSEDGKLRSYHCDVYEYEPATGARGRRIASLWLNANTLYAEKRTVYLENGSTITTEFKNYKKIGDLPFAHSIENFQGDALLATIKIEQVKINPGTLDLFYTLR